ncbi:hypothetical protein K8I28_01955, partial [bacterium]|nr:hypothetical protein [bacterium]
MRRSGLYILHSLLAIFILSISVYAEESWNISETSRIFSHWDIVHDFVAVDGFIYVASGGTGVNVLDASDPEAISETTRFEPLELDGSIRSVALKEQYLYAGDGNVLQLFSLNDPANPVEISNIELPASIVDITPWQEYALCLLSSNALKVIDLNDIENPLELPGLSFGGRVVDLVILGEFAYISAYPGLYVVSLENVEQLELVSMVANQGVSNEIFTDGELLFWRKLTNYILVYDPSDPTDLEWLNSGIFHRAIESCTVYQNNIYVTSTDELGERLMSISTLTNQHNFEQLAEYEIPTSSHLMHVSNNTLYTISNDLAAIYTLANPLNPVFAGVYDVSGFVSDVARDGNIVYVADEEGGVRIVSISDTEFPVEISTFETTAKVTGVAY